MEKTTRFESILEKRGNERRIDYSLERLQAALQELGSPEKSVHTLVIGGTNGKGTVSTLTSAALIEAGYRVGTYLSPHLLTPHERFLNALVPETDESLASLAEELEPTANRHGLTYFEFATLIAFVWNRRQKFDFLVLEVGLGGRLDATNVTHPLATAITTIDFDHQDYLGNTLDSILNEKMGILRHESLVFSGIRDPQLIEKMENRCRELDAVAYYSEQIRCQTDRVDWSGQEIQLNGFPFTLTNPSVGTAENAAIAFLLLRIVFPRIPIETLQKSFSRVVTPARMEVVSDRPRVVLSGDHNPAGIKCLLETLDRLQVPKEKLRITCAFSPDKPYEQMFASLAQRSCECLLTQVTRLAPKMPAGYRELGRFVEDPREAVLSVMRRASAEDTILVTGSLYLTGEVRSLWRPDVRFLI